MKNYNSKRDIPGEYFPMPKAIFWLDLDAGEIAVLAFLMYCEDRQPINVIRVIRPSVKPSV